MSTHPLNSLLTNMKDLDPAFSKVVDEHFWGMVGEQRMNEQENGQQAMKDLYASRETAISKLMKTVEDLQSRIQIIEAGIGGDLLDVVTRAENLWKDQETRIEKLEKSVQIVMGRTAGMQRLRG